MTGDTSEALSITTAEGFDLAGVLARSDAARAVAVLTHPHPQMGGDMDNPVPATLARCLAAAGVAALRFNFRGTGASGGDHGGGDPERGDVTAAIDAATRLVPGVPVVGIGYSFGADVLLGTGDDRLALVVAVAPPLRILPADILRGARGRGPTLILSPAHDQFCDPDAARSATVDWPDTEVEAVAGADHFLAGASQRVAERALSAIEALFG